MNKVIRRLIYKIMAIQKKETFSKTTKVIFGKNKNSTHSRLYYTACIIHALNITT